VDYISYMRDMIGNKPMFLVGGGTLIKNESGEILLIKRTDNGTWGIPGGSCELVKHLKRLLSGKHMKKQGWK